MPYLEFDAWQFGAFSAHVIYITCHTHSVSSDAKGITTSHLHIQLDPFASKMTIYFLGNNDICY